MKSFRPLVYRQILKSRLIPSEVLESVYRALVAEIDSAESPTENPPAADPSEGDDETDFVLADEPSGAESDRESDSESTDFELGSTPMETSDTDDSGSVGEEIPIVRQVPAQQTPVQQTPTRQTPAQERLERELPAALERAGYLNPWQVAQIQRSRSRFYLGAYRIIESCGAGGYGHVFLARTDKDPSNAGIVPTEPKRPTDVAIKVLPRSEANPRTIAQFRREIDIHRDRTHPNLVRFLDSGIDANVHYAVYEYMDGGTARQLDSRAVSTPISIAATIIHETAKGLLSLHQCGYIHRDLKPGNILLSLNGEIKLGDLGMATRYEGGLYAEIQALRPKEILPPSGHPFDTEAASEGGRKVAGTSDYMAPDQILSPNDPTLAWDIYSLGCTFYFLVTGIVPFPAGSPTQKIHAHLKSDAPDARMFNPALPWELSRLIQQMMDKSPEKRPAGADVLLKRLRPFTTTKAEVAEFLAQKRSMEANAPKMSAMVRVTLDEILAETENVASETGESFSEEVERSLLAEIESKRGEAESQKGGESPELPESPVPPIPQISSLPASTTTESDERGDLFLERLNTILVWFVLFPLSLVGLALVVWFFFAT